MKKQNVKAFCDDAFSGGSVLDSGMSKRAIDILWPPEFSSDARGESDDRANQFAQMLSRGTHTAHMEPERTPATQHPRRRASVTTKPLQVVSLAREALPTSVPGPALQCV